MRQLGVFAKYWQPGQVKTRLAASIGAELASRIARCMLDVTLSRFVDCGDRRVLAVTPASRRVDFARLAGTAWTVELQGEGDLGARMRHFFKRAFAGGAQRVVLIGSDSPLLPITYVEQAFEALQTTPVVLGPSDDGGYYLIGARVLPPIFDNMPWSTAQVYPETIARLQASSMEYASLPHWYDVDGIDGLHRLRAELSREPGDWLDELRKAVEEGASRADTGTSMGN